MKVIHVLAKNLDTFIEAVEGTEYTVNASRHPQNIINTLPNFNARDTVGLVVFANPMTKKCLELMRSFEDLFVFKSMPIIVINDRVNDLYANGYFSFCKHSKLYLVESEENSISDIQLNSICTTLLVSDGCTYELDRCKPEEEKKKKERRDGHEETVTMSEQLSTLLQLLEKGDVDSK